jgi:allantoin racemase
MKIGLIGATQAAVAGLGAPAELAAIAAPGTVIQAYATRGAIFAHTPVEFALQQINYLDTALRAAADGCDALILNSFSDYGLAAIRAAVSIPVVGAAEATLRFAPTIGPRFSIVTVWPESTNYMPRALLREYGAEAACIRIRNAGAAEILAGDGRPDLFIAGMQHGQAAILQRILAECEAAAKEDGIDAILLGCTCMSPIAARIAAGTRLPVVNPMAVALKTAEMRAVLGLGASRREQGALRPAALDLARRMVDAIAAAPAEDTDCPVCVVAAAE